MASVDRRMSVIGPTFGLMTLGVLVLHGCFVGMARVTPAEFVVYMFGPLAGPFVGFVGPAIGLEADPVEYMCAIGLPPLVLMLLHPISPRWWTGLLCVVGVLLWFCLGMIFIHQADG